MLKCLHNKKILYFIPYLALGLMGTTFFMRAYFGFDWSDECYYVALPYRFVLGDHLFTDSWDIHQTGAILAIPVLSLYRKIVGNMDGIILFMRLLFVIFQGIVSILVYRTAFKLYESRLTALLAAGICYSFVPFSLSTFSYNTVSYLLVTVTAMFLILIYQTNNIVKISVLSAIAGVAFACSCLAYPFFLIVFPSFVLLLCMIRPVKVKDQIEEKTWNGILFFVCGCCLVAIIVGIYVMRTTGFQDVLSNIRFLFHDPEHPPINFFVKTSLFIKDYYHLLFLAMLQLFLLIMILLRSYVKVDPYIHTVIHFLIKFFLPFCMIVNVLIILWKPISTVPFTSKINQMQICVGFWPIILYALNPSKKNLMILLSMYLPANLMCWAVYLGSNNGITGASYPLILAVVSACFMIHENYAPIIRKMKRNGLAPYGVLLRGGLAAIAVLIIGVNFVLRVQTVYRDEPIQQLTVQMTSGPAKGIYTTPYDAKNYEAIIQDIKTSVPKKGRVAFPGLLPFAYLCTEQKPAPQSLWRTPLDSSRMTEYFKYHPENRPYYIYIVKGQYGLKNVSNKQDIESAEKATGKKVTEKETKYSYQYTVVE